MLSPRSSTQLHGPAMLVMVSLTNGGYYGYLWLRVQLKLMVAMSANTGTALGDWMYPEIDIFGFTMTGFNSAYGCYIKC